MTQQDRDTDHSGYAETFDDKTYEDGIRACIAALPKVYTLDQGIDAEMAAFNDAVEQSRAALQALLPTPPDPAKALVDEYEATLETDSPVYRQNREHFARWLITEGRIG